MPRSRLARGRKGSAPTDEGGAADWGRRNCRARSIQRATFGPCRGPRRGQSRLKSERLPCSGMPRAVRGQFRLGKKELPCSGRAMGRAGRPRVRAFRFRRNRPEPPEPIRRTSGRVSGAHPRDGMAPPSPGREDPCAGPVTPARRIRPAAASAHEREADRRPPPDSPLASPNTRRG